MPYVTGDLVDQVLNRVRDPNGMGTPRDLVRLFLTHLQRLVNCRFASVVATASLTTNASQNFYQVPPTVLADSMRLVGIREGSRDLGKVPWQQFFYLSTSWHQQIGTSFYQWSMIGRDFLIIYPAKAAGSSVTLVYAKLTAVLTDDLVAIEIPDDEVPLLLDLCEAIIYLKQRTYVPLAKLMEVVTMRIAEG